MSQHDLTIANQGFPAFRADLNDALQALGSCQSGTSAPSPTFANQLWYDTTNNILKIRNEDNDAWISIATLDQTADSVSAITATTLNGSTVNAGDLNATGNTVLGDASTDTLNVGNGGLVKDSSGNVGIGTSSPATKLTVKAATNVNMNFNTGNTTSNARMIALNDAGNATVGMELQAATHAFLINASDGLRITSTGVVEPTQGQIKFPATQSASSDANTLDDYEEGTWTPNIGGTGVITTNGASYTKIGNAVYWLLDFSVTSLGTGQTTLVQGLPFIPAGINGTVSVGYFADLAVSPVFISGYTSAGIGQIVFTGMTSAAANILNPMGVLKTGSRIICGGFFRV